MKDEEGNRGKERKENDRMKRRKNDGEGGWDEREEEAGRRANEGI